MWEKLCSRVVSVLDFNQATLSGCIDIICVRNKEFVELDTEDGKVKREKYVYRSTPFHVRFGKAKLLKSREKIVSIYVNDQLSSLTMKLGAAGEAFFGEETEDDETISQESSLSRNTQSDHGELRCTSFHNGGTSTSTSLAHFIRSDGEMIDYSYYAYNKSVVSSSRRAKSDDLELLKDEITKDTSWSWDWGDIPRRTDTSAVSEDQILQFSLCGHLLSCHDDQLNAELFRANLVDWSRLDNDPSLWYHESLVACFDGRPPYYQSKIALPLLASWIVYNRPLSISAIEKLLKTSIVTNVDDSNNRRKLPATQTQKETKRTRISLRPTSEQLESLNLKLGPNKITFTVYSSLQGIKSVNATIYLWPCDAQIVISDIDGTITKSDALGHIMPILGRDWSHVGVAELFSKIRANGYYVLYLSARAIGQADYTREYLFGLTQNQKEKLPQGPLFLSPDRLLSSFKREVISKSAYMFKIPALRDIRNLFPPENNPFYAGFGNNASDHRAYVSVGVPESRVFIINPSGVIKHVNSSYARTYETMSEIAELMFPPNHPKSREDERYNSFRFWNFPIHMDINNTLEE